MCAQSAAMAKKGKKASLNLNFSELDDLFLNTKGKALRNLRKKVERYVDLDKNARKGELQASAQQKEQIKSIPSLQQEIADLEEVCQLYMKSNPGYAKKEESKGALSQEDINKAVSDALAFVSKGLQIKALIAEDESFVTSTAEQRASLDSLCQSVTDLNVAEKFTGFTQSSFAGKFANLSSSSEDVVTEGGVSFADLKSWMSEVSEADIKTKMQEAADLAAEMAADAAAEEAEAAAAAAAKAQAEAAAKEEVKVEEAKPAEAEVAQEPATETPAAVEGQAVATEGQAAQEESQPAAEGQTERRGGRGGNRDNRVRRDYGDDNGERRGRGDRGDRRGRGGRGDRGDRGGYNRGRGGNFRGAREDADGFVTETGEKPKPRRTNNYRGGRGGDRGDYRGGRGDGRGGQRGGDWSERRGGDWGDRRGGRGGRPQTAQDGGNNDAAQQQQPAAQNDGAAQANGQQV